MLTAAGDQHVVGLGLDPELAEPACRDLAVPAETDIDLRRKHAADIDVAFECRAYRRQRGVVHRMRREVVGQIDEGRAWGRYP